MPQRHPTARLDGTASTALRGVITSVGIMKSAKGQEVMQWQGVTETWEAAGNQKQRHATHAQPP